MSKFILYSTQLIQQIYGADYQTIFNISVESSGDDQKKAMIHGVSSEKETR